jgi:hypothetical protein
MGEEKVRTEVYKVSGDEVVAKITEIVKEDNSGGLPDGWM